MHILSCRYNLTRTGYKYLEIGIGIPPTADAVAVNIMLENTTDKEILLSTEMWRGLVDSRSIICDYLARVNSEHCPTPPMCLDDLTVRFATLNDQPTIRLDTPSGRLTLSTSTVRYLYGLRHCVKRITSTMASVVGRVESKLRASSTSLRVLRILPAFSGPYATARTSTKTIRSIVNCWLWSLEIFRLHAT
ncbi:hypothetical protein X777_15526 [Ooceraea biroi]|uniref:Uncharacterized protein n=1 Tax=Ooceraea biroi TaxID=2015173 RepID=A0A026X611_OOCBI|nr:hypothetical protein X777_15526 [Ooceraea biroi]